MNLQFPKPSLEQVPGEILILFHSKEHLLPKGPLARVDRILNGLVSRLLVVGKFQGLPSESLLLATSNKFTAGKVLVLGLGRMSDLCWEALRGAYASAISSPAKLKAKEIIVTVPPEAPPSLLDETAKGLLPAILTPATRSGISPSDLRLFFYEKGLERRDRLIVLLREAIHGALGDLSAQVSFQEGDCPCAI